MNDKKLTKAWLALGTAFIITISVATILSDKKEKGEDISGIIATIGLASNIVDHLSDTNTVSTNTVSTNAVSTNAVSTNSLAG